MKIRVKDFNLEATLESGQVFGFTKNSAGEYQSIISDTLVRLYQDQNFLCIESNGSSIQESSVRTYFDLDHDLAVVYDL